MWVFKERDYCYLSTAPEIRVLLMMMLCVDEGGSQHGVECVFGVDDG